MRLKTLPIEIPDDAPFKNDLLGRSDSATAIENLIASSLEGLVLCINAPWGAGKTTFLLMLRRKLELSGYRTLSFNAWESDFVDDAMVALLGELSIEVEQMNTGCPDPAAGTFRKLQRVAGRLMKSVIPLAVRIGTSGVFNLENSDIQEAIAGKAEEIAEAQIQAYELAKESVAAFRSTLEELAKEISVSGKPLVLFVDELDRCRPPFAVRVLEIIKHFFSVPGIVFVLALDREQLGHSVTSMYGVGMDVSGYLRRFFDLEFNLPVGRTGSFVRAQIERFGLTDVLNERSVWTSENEITETARTFENLFLVFGCNARDQERCFAQLVLVLKTCRTPQRIKLGALLPMIVLRIKQPERYRAFVLRKISHREILDDLESSARGNDFLATTDGVSFAWLLRALVFIGDSRRLVQLFESERQAEAGTRREPAIVEVLEWAKSGYLLDHRGKLGEFDKLINMVDHFS